MMRIIAGRSERDSRVFKVVEHDGVIEIAYLRRTESMVYLPSWIAAGLLFELIQNAMTRGARKIMVNLDGNGEACSSLLAVLVDARAQARRAGKELILRGSPALNELASICRLEHVLDE